MSYPPVAAAASAPAAPAAASASAAASAAPVPVSATGGYPLVRSDVNSLPIGAHLPPPPGGLYIGNLAWWVTDQDLCDLLCPLGELSCVRIVFDRLNGKSKGFAYAEFVRPEHAAMAMHVLSTAQLAGRTLDVAPTSYARIQATHANFKTAPPPRKSVRPNGDGIDYEVNEFASRAGGSSSGGRDGGRDGGRGGGGPDLMPPMGGGGPMRGGPYGGMPPPPMGMMGPMGMNPMMGPMGGFMPGPMGGMGGGMNPMMMGGPMGMMGGRMGGPPMGMMGGMGNAAGSAASPAGAAVPPRIRLIAPYETHTDRQNDNRRRFCCCCSSGSALLFALCNSPLFVCPLAVRRIELCPLLPSLALSCCFSRCDARCTRSLVEPFFFPSLCRAVLFDGCFLVVCCGCQDSRRARRA